MNPSTAPSTTASPADGGPQWLSTSEASPAQCRLALGTVLVSALLFAALAPFAKQPLAQVWPFIPVYQSALVVNDLITAALLFGQFHILRRPALLVLAGGYLFTAAMAMLHMLSFPGLFAPTGLLGAGPQSTAWMYMFWHAGFPLCVMAYVLCSASDRNTRPQGSQSSRMARTGWAVLVCSALALLAAGAATLLATAGQALLPPIMQGNRYTPAMIFVVSSAWAFSALALLMLWRQKQRSVMDVWLMVVMCAWLFDMALSAVLNAGRFDLGFYAGRLYGLLAASFVLVVLLLENSRLYAQLGAAHQREHQKNANLQHLNDELANANSLLADFNEQLQRAGRFRSEFLAHMSHELRTPLNAIIGFSDLLKDGLVGPERQQRYAGLINQGGHHLLSLINDVLDLSKVEAGKMSLDLERFEPNEFLASCLATFDEARERRGLQLQLQRLPGQPPELVADARKLRQLVYNLLSNAIKFTPDGGRITLSVQRVGAEGLRLDDAGGRATRVLPLPDAGSADSGGATQVPSAARTLYLEIRVSDSGSGMRGEDLPQLFEAFRQLKSTDSRKVMGTGLGLALVGRFAALHGGTVGVASAPGQGTTFAVWIPWREEAVDLLPSSVPQASARNGQAAAVAEAPPARPRHALVIEDDAAAAELLRLHLESAGFRVSVVANGDALMQFINPPPDVITLDILLPGASAGGWAVLEQIKNNPALTAVPVVIVSVVPDQQRGFALGASTVLQKPVTRRALLEAVESAGMNRPAGHAHRVLVVDDDPHAVELVASSLQSPGRAVMRAFDGASAISMARDVRPDLIVLDLMMPGVSGFDVVDSVRQQPEMAGTPILVMTAKTLSLAERERLNGRVLQIVAKESFDQRGFLSEVQRALKGHGAGGAAAAR